jgi:cytochrome c peroxidase
VTTEAPATPQAVAEMALDEPIRPIPPAPPVDPDVLELGKRLFHDERLSTDGSTSCATCHDIAAGGDDGLPTSMGVAGSLGAVNAPTVLNAVHNFRQFWDGRAADLLEQADGPLLAAGEMGWSDWDALLGEIERHPDLVELFDRAFDAPPSRERVLQALVAYETALVTPNAPFDRWLRGEQSALSPEAHAGYLEFKRVGCIACHQGVNVGGNMFQRVGRVQASPFEDPEHAADNLGRFEQTGVQRDRFRFKVPSLRNVALTAPYLHDGSLEDLPSTIQFMAEYQLGEQLDVEQVTRIAAFLESLTGELSPDLLP